MNTSVIKDFHFHWYMRSLSNLECNLKEISNITSRTIQCKPLIVEAFIRLLYSFILPDRESARVDSHCSAKWKLARNWPVTSPTQWLIFLSHITIQLNIEYAPVNEVHLLTHSQTELKVVKRKYPLLGKQPRTNINIFFRVNHSIIPISLWTSGNDWSLWHQPRSAKS